MDIINMLPEYLNDCLKDFLHFMDPYFSILVGAIVFVVIVKKVLQKL